MLIMLISVLFFLFLVSTTNALHKSKIKVGESTQYIINGPLCQERNDDYSEKAPLLEVGGRVMELIDGEHFDSILRDTPNHMRPPAIIAFWNSFDNQCSMDYNALDFEDGIRFNFPSRAFLYAAK
eukprot:UN13039